MTRIFERQFFKCKMIKYTGTDKKRMEIPESVLDHTVLPDDFKFQSQRK